MRAMTQDNYFSLVTWSRSFIPQNLINILFWSNLEVKRPIEQSFIELLEATRLIHRLQPFGYGKDVLPARYKVYLADAAIAPAVLLKEKSLIDDPAALGVATETEVFKHLVTHYYHLNVRFSCRCGKKDREVDLAAEVSRPVPESD